MLSPISKTIFSTLLSARLWSSPNRCDLPWLKFSCRSLQTRMVFMCLFICFLCSVLDSKSVMSTIADDLESYISRSKLKSPCGRGSWLKTRSCKASYITSYMIITKAIFTLSIQTQSSSLSAPLKTHRARPIKPRPT
jgi:hypothetical protein